MCFLQNYKLNMKNYVKPNRSFLLNALICIGILCSYKSKAQKVSTLDSLSQKLNTIDSLKYFIKGKWQLSTDSNVTWFFKNDSIAYLYYATSPNETDSCSYKITDTFKGNGENRRAKFLVLKYKNESNDIEYFKCFILNEYFMYLRDSNDKYYDFKKK